MPNTGAPHNLPYPSLLDAPNGPVAIQALAEQIVARLNQPVVTSLPGSPVDGQRCLYLADGANGIIWDLRYRAAASGAYKWERVGASPLAAETSGGTRTGETWGEPGTTNSPAVTVPLAGVYRITASARGWITNSPGNPTIGLQIGGVNPPTDGNGDISEISGPNAGSDVGTTSTLLIDAPRRTIATAGTVIKVVARTSPTGVGAVAETYSLMKLFVEPVRVG